MENQEQNNLTEEKIKETIRGLVEKMGFPSEIEIVESQDQEGVEKSLICNIKTKDSSFLIGQYGVNLQSLQHISRILIKQKAEQKINFILDVNSYRQEKNSSIIRLAIEMAEQAIRERRAVVLRPMSPYERRIVHLELSKNNQIRTESIGDGENRKVVISPVDLT
jgi:spoIIIJ-associated protein